MIRKIVLATIAVIVGASIPLLLNFKGYESANVVSLPQVLGDASMTKVTTGNTLFDDKNSPNDPVNKPPTTSDSSTAQTTTTTSSSNRSPNNSTQTSSKKAFYLTSKTTDISTVQFKVSLADGSTSNSVTAESEDDLEYGDAKTGTSSPHVSQMYYYQQGINQVALLTGGSDVQVNYITVGNTGLSATGGQLDVQYDYEKNYEKSLFAQLGFNIITREEWGAPSYSLWYPQFSKINRIVVHHTATSVDMANPSNTVYAIYQDHKVRCSNNVGTYPNDCPNINDTWQDIGYNYLIDPYGNIYQGRAGGNSVIGAHAIPNSGSIGISLLGNYQTSQPTAAMMDTLTRLIAALSTLNNFQVTWQTSLFGHRDYLNTACPGDNVYSRLPQVAIDAENYKTNNFRRVVAELGFADEFLQKNPSVYVDGDVKLTISTRGVSDMMKLKLATRSWSGKFGGGAYRNDAIAYVDPAFAQTFIAEVSLAIPQAQFYVPEELPLSAPSL